MEHQVGEVHANFRMRLQNTALNRAKKMSEPRFSGLKD